MEALIFIIVIVAYMSAPVVFLLTLEISNRKEKRRKKKQKAYQQHIEDLEMQIEIKEYQKRWVKAWRKKYMPDDPRVTFDEAFCIGCIFNTTSCSFDHYGLSTPDQWFLPDLEDEEGRYEW